MTPKKSNARFVTARMLASTALPPASLARSIFDAELLAVCALAAYASAAGGHADHVKGVPLRKIR